MSEIVEFIRRTESVDTFSGCTDEQVTEAQKALNMTFPEEFVSYVKAFGAIAFFDAEWTGLNTESYQNVVEVTLSKRELAGLPEGYFVLENLGIDGILIIVDQNGTVFEFQHGTIQKINNSILEYLTESLRQREEFV
ncbi:MAG: SMI1/KNR4 family protein [Oscillospiraceae bacterium]|nr:SMI1/KNR4 family protein [Oscillospiraceae bacterium]